MLAWHLPPLRDVNHKPNGFGIAGPRLSAAIRQVRMSASAFFWNARYPTGEKGSGNQKLSLPGKLRNAASACGPQAALPDTAEALITISAIHRNFTSRRPRYCKIGAALASRECGPDRVPHPPTPRQGRGRHYRLAIMAVVRPRIVIRFFVRWICWPHRSAAVD
jgi:hypothetical protein